MPNTPNSKVRMFGSLHSLRRRRGLSPSEEMCLPSEGTTGLALAHKLNLPLDEIDGIFINDSACSLDDLIRPGDKVDFVAGWRPTGHIGH
ncbi:hypothetical protein A7E78_00060 [Syntrophotalea acetylenivorans]|uniref:Ubiquitin Mut7-C domain-containing protein n=2 Tax=Syntrophotalea acetylenivorans TaxID=1842532 RepID=A0A1L3GKE8_9BACT|nr:hypothetical protein A7E78_00060 [Syntrophotalea acetylenivorans]